MSSAEERVERLLDKIVASGAITLDPPLSDAELLNAEQRFGFTFPGDIRMLLKIALPRGEPPPSPWSNGETSAGFPNWRDVESPKLREQMEWPTFGVLFDVREAGFWLDSWGSRPADVEDRVAEASRRMVTVPKLVPIYGHRYMCEEPRTEGNPVLSVWQTDIIYYGCDLENYLSRDFPRSAELEDRPPFAREPARVPFWSDVIDYDDYEM